MSWQPFFKDIAAASPLTCELMCGSSFACCTKVDPKQDSAADLQILQITKGARDAHGIEDEELEKHGATSFG